MAPITYQEPGRNPPNGGGGGQPPRNGYNGQQSAFNFGKNLELIYPKITILIKLELIQH